jgi:hypothetical protein
MYEMSQRHPVWVAENHVNPCNSVYKYKYMYRKGNIQKYSPVGDSKNYTCQ